MLYQLLLQRDSAIFSRIVEFMVKPEVDSNIASAKFNISPLCIKGRFQKKKSSNQVKVSIANPSLNVFHFLFFWFKIEKQAKTR